MKLAIDDKCKDSFRLIKFEKTYRYIIYKVQDEKVVLTLPFRLRRNSEYENKLGIVS